MHFERSRVYIANHCHPSEGEDPYVLRHDATLEMDSRLRGNDKLIFVVRKGLVSKRVVCSYFYYSIGETT